MFQVQRQNKEHVVLPLNGTKSLRKSEAATVSQPLQVQLGRAKACGFIMHVGFRHPGERKNSSDWRIWALLWGLIWLVILDLINNSQVLFMGTHTKANH
jgi:hypothetical protein